MIVKNLETIERAVFRLEAIIETDRLDDYDRSYLLQAIAILSAVCERHAIARELGVDDTNTHQENSR